MSSSILTFLNFNFNKKQTIPKLNFKIMKTKNLKSLKLTTLNYQLKTTNDKESAKCFLMEKFGKEDWEILTESYNICDIYNAFAEEANRILRIYKYGTNEK